MNWIGGFEKKTIAGLIFVQSILSKFCLDYLLYLCYRSIFNKLVMCVAKVPQLIFVFYNERISFGKFSLTLMKILDADFTVCRINNHASINITCNTTLPVQNNQTNTD